MTPAEERITRYVSAITATIQREATASTKEGVSSAEVFGDMVSALATVAAFWLTFTLRRAGAFRMVPNFARQIIASINVIKDPER